MMDEDEVVVRLNLAEAVAALEALTTSCQPRPHQGQPPHELRPHTFFPAFVGNSLTDVPRLTGETDGVVGLLSKLNQPEHIPWDKFFVARKPTTVEELWEAVRDG